MEQMIFILIWVATGFFAISLIAHMRFVLYIFKKKKEYQLSFGKIIGFLLYLFGQFMMNILFLYVTVRFKKIYAGGMAIVAFVITLFPIKQLQKILDDVVEKASVDEKYEYIVRKSEIEQKYYLLMKDYEDKLSKLRHEFMNQVQVAYHMIEKSDKNKIGTELLDELSEQIEATRVNTFCSNKMVNIILSMKQDEFLENRLKLETDVILSGEIRVEEMDLCTVIMSMLDEIIEIEAVRNVKVTNTKVTNRENIGEEENYGGKDSDWHYHKVSLDIRRKNGMIRIMTKQKAIEEQSDKQEIQKIIGYYRKIMKPVMDQYNGEMYVKDYKEIEAEENDELTIIVTIQEKLVG